MMFITLRVSDRQSGTFDFWIKMLNNLEQSGFRSDFTTRGEWAEADKSECSESRVVLEETIVTSACYNDNTQLHDDQLR